MEASSGKAFLIYNEREDSIEQIAAALESAGIPFYFWRRDVKYGTSIDEKEQEEFDSAGVFLLFLGRYGWGPNHQALAQTALNQMRKVIPVLIGDPPPDDADAEKSVEKNFFKNTRYFDLRKLDKPTLARFVKVVREELLPPAQQVISTGEYDHVIKVLKEGTERQRNFILDKIRNAIWIDKPLLSEKIREELQKPAPDPETSPTHHQDQIWLWRALVYADAETPENRSAIQTMMQWTDVDTRFWALASLYEVKASYLPDMVGALLSEHLQSDPHALALAIQDPHNPSTIERFRSTLHSNSQDAWIPTQVLTVVPIPELVPDLCENLELEYWVSPDLTLKALSHPVAAPLAAEYLTAKNRMKSTLDRMVNTTGNLATKPPQFDLTRYYAVLLNAFDQQTVRETLEAALKNEETGDAAELLIDDWQAWRRRVKSHSTAGFYSDTIEGVADQLDIQEDVQTLAAVMLAKTVSPPLAIGLFGDWGSGKSFFMNAMKETVEKLAEENKKLSNPPFCTAVVPIEFNAWHYVDTNLWASLVSKIFDVLSNYVTPKKTAGEQQVEIFKNLEQAKREVGRVEGEKKQTEEELNNQTTKLLQLEQSRESLPLSLSELKKEDIYEFLESTEKEKLREALTQMGIPAAMSSVADLERVISEVCSTKGRITTLFLSVINSKNRKLLVILLTLVLVVIPVAFWLIQRYIDVNSIIIGVATVISEGVAVLTGIAVVIRKGLTYVNQGLQTIENSKKKMEQRIAEIRATPTQEEEETKERIKKLKQKETELTGQLSTARTQVEMLEAKMSRSVEEESLAHFLAERIRSGDYRKHLGLISMIRQDFDDLEKRLEWLQKQKNPQLKKVERIILYIDDLDRCPAEKVIDVLQAIHLILAYRLFVVVVGVDPRWLVHSLSKTYSAFQTESNRFTLDPEHWQATPQNYLEKIFQVPFSLRAMTGTGYAKLIKSLFLPPGQQITGAEEKETTGQNRPQQYDQMAQPGDEEKMLPATRPRQEQPLAEPDTEKEQKESTVKAETVSGLDTEKQPAPSIHEESLLVKEWETAFAEKLFPLMPTPRAAKRFSNTYRILKAPLQPAQLIVFEGTKEYPGDFQVPMLLLAMLIGAPGEATVLFPRLQQYVLNGNQPVDGLLSIAQLELSGQQFEHLLGKIEPIITEPAFPTAAKVFAFWIPRVSRFSFDLGKVIQPVDLGWLSQETGKPFVNESGHLVNAP